jgi:hypothetical protein
MNRVAVGGVALVLIGVFIALSVSVVNARRPLDARVSRSFDAAAPKAVGRNVSIQPRGCVKRRLDSYRCGVDVRRRGGSSRSIYWFLLLRDDGCWSTYVRWPALRPGSAEAKLGYPKGCAG